jgi:DNA-binding IclR family transcriptional regulator
MPRADEKNRRDYFFCQLARLNFVEGQSDKDGWVAVPEAARKTGYSEDELQDFLERLVEDGWIEVQGSTETIPSSARLTLAGKARAQVICNTHH